MTKRLLCLLVGVSVLGFAAPDVWAWNPYTHEFTAETARAPIEVDANGHPCLRIALTNKCYPLAAGVGEAIASSPEVFRGGVIGPDGFPDLIMGQSIIHPLDNHNVTIFDPTRVGTGRWLRYLVQKARASNDPRALAFAYGFMTHAAGDMWGHTFVNDFARGVFPSISGTLSELANPLDLTNFALGVEHLANSIRHELTELYIRDTTPGWDGDPDITPARYGECKNNDTPDDNGCCPASNPFCHVSDNATEPVDLGEKGDYPIDFIYQTLVDPNAVGAPSTSRGVLIEFFLSLQQWLRDHERVDVTKPFKEAASDYDNLAPLAANWQEDCFDDNDGGSPEVDGFPGAGILDAAADAAECTATTAEITVVAGFDVLHSGFTLASQILETSLEILAAAYFKAWDDDITDGLHHWGEFGLAVSESLFDPGTRREWQFEACRKFDTGGTDQLTRDHCLKGFGIFDTLLANDDYLNFRDDHLYRMLGLPDFVGDLDSVLRKIADSTVFRALKDVIEDFTPIAAGLKDLVWVSDQIQAFIEHLIEEQIKQYFHIDINIEAVRDMFNYPDAWLAVGDLGTSITNELFNLNVNLSLFKPTDHPRIDSLVGLGPNHHVPVPLPIPDFPAEAERLADNAEIQRPMFAAYENTIQMSQLLLLDGDGLNQLLGDVLVSAGFITNPAVVQTYQNHGDSNVMFDTLAPQAGASQVITDEPWLLSIDSDHAWRKDPLPAFCTGANCTDPTVPVRDGWLNGGNGRFPIWESCLLRGAFRTMFKGWQEAAAFADDGDDPSPDPSDPNAPTAAFSILPSFTGSLNGVPTTFVNNASIITVVATDQVFASSKLGVQFRAFKTGTTPGGFTAGAQNMGSFNIASHDDGLWTLEIQTQDPCHTFAVESSEGTAGVDALPPGDQTSGVVLDTTGPVITITAPAAGQILTTSTVLVLQFGANDGALGSGVKTITATLDGATVVNGQSIDLFNFSSGTHTLIVNSTDNLGNSSSTTRTFRVRPTPASMLSSVDRGFAAGQINNHAGLDQSLHDKLTQAVTASNQGNFATESSLINGVLHQLISTRGSQCSGPPTATCFQIDPALADRLIIEAAELLATVDFTNAQYLADPPTLQILEALDQAYVKAKLSLQLYSTVIDNLIAAVVAEHKGQLDQAQNLLLSTVNNLLSARDQTCTPSPTNPNCPLVDKATDEQLITRTAELAAVINVPAAALPGVQSLRDLLAEVDRALLTGLLKPSSFYEILRRNVTMAIAAKVAGQTSNEKSDLSQFEITVENALATECRTTPNLSCYSIDPTEGTLIDNQAKAIYAGL